MARNVDPLEAMPVSRYAGLTRWGLRIVFALLVLFLYLPIIFMVAFSFDESSTPSLPIQVLFLPSGPTPAPTLALVHTPDNDTGTSAFDNVTNVLRPRFVGTAPVGDLNNPNRVQLENAITGQVSAVTFIREDTLRKISDCFPASAASPWAPRRSGY